VVVAAVGDEFELARFVVALLGILACKQKALDLGSRVQGVAVGLELLVGVALEHAAQVAGVGGSVLVDDVAEDQYLAGAENICRHPVEGAPVDAEAKVAFLLRRKPADRRPVKGEVLVGAEQELLIVIEQVKAAFEVAEQHSDGLDPLFIGQVFQPLLADLVGRRAVGAVCLGCQVKLFQLLIREGKEIPVLSRHGSPSWRKKVQSRRSRTLAAVCGFVPIG